MTIPSITRVSGFSLVVADLERALTFFQDAFDAVTAPIAVGTPEEASLLGLAQVRIERSTVSIGSQSVDLLAFDPPGHAYPADGGSTDLWFQHFAIIVSDMAAAYARLQAAGRFSPISASGPVLLPPASGSVSAFKFRDGEGHPLELLSFPQGKAPPSWASKRGLFLGIDHSAIAVSDTQRSIAFFKQAFGLRLGQQTENEGKEQAEMDAVPDARVTVSGLMPEYAPPHVELLGYKVGSRRPIDPGSTSADIAATCFTLETPDIAPVVAALTAMDARFISPGVVTMADRTLAIMVLDPDGHRFIVRQPAG